MANSLEVRAPFLDPDLADATAQLPDRFLVRNGLGKYLIRAIMKDDLPTSVFTHPKKGFGIPLYKYQNDAFRTLQRSLFRKDHALFELLDFETVQRVAAIGLSNQTNNAKISVYKSMHRLWMLMQLFGWFDRFAIRLPSNS